jgi:hypothetical protein
MECENPPSYDKAKIEAFVDRWTASNASERANAQLFAREFCDLLGVEPPRPAVGDPQLDTYCFERPVSITRPDGTTTTNFIDLYKRAHFVLESKQGSERRAGDDVSLLPQPAKRKGTAVRGTGSYDVAMQSAYVQAERYAKALDEWPPFLIVSDVGYCFELYASFDGSGKYRHFPAPGEHRIAFGRLVEPAVFKLFRNIFTDPKELDPSRHAAKITQDIAALVAKLAVSLEKSGHAPELVAKFLMRCLFTMFAEDVGLLPPAENGQGLFTHALEHQWVPNPQSFPSQIAALWQTMNAGGAMFGVAGKILKFNGGLFADPAALPMTREQLQVLQLAALADWSGVEPAIFGTLLERALNPKERHRLGAHFTPRTYVERLVAQTIEETIRDEWNLVRAEVRQIVTSGGKIDDARKVLRGFHHRLVAIKVLDPACGSGNFLYVTLDLFKRIEAEVLAELADLGDKQMLLDVQHVSVNPGQFLGIEIKPWAREIADLCLWIGYLQWHHRTRGKLQPAEPVLREYHNIECRDALIEYDRKEPVLDGDGRPVTRWDGETMKLHPSTGEEIPDDAARVSLDRYISARRAAWPQADFIVGNPPFLGKLHLNAELGEGYTAALRSVYGDQVPDSADFVMYWWARAAEATAAGNIRRFGLITTKSITQTLNRRVVASALDGTAPIHLVFAIPNHPWVDTSVGAAVRIAMTVGEAGRGAGRLSEVASETETTDGSSAVTFSTKLGVIHENLTVGADVASATPLLASWGLASMGPMLGSRGFVIDGAQRKEISRRDGADVGQFIRPLRNGRDLTARPRGVFAIDLDGINEIADVRSKFPALYQHIYDTVKPERDQNNDPKLRQKWWLFRRSNELQRQMIRGLSRAIVTVETAKHRVFVFLPTSTLAEHGTITIGLDDPYCLGVLSSRFHVAWALAAGGRLGVGNDPRYNKTRCFDPFPFPDAKEQQRKRIGKIAEQIDAHRWRQLEAYSGLTMTNIYNVLAKLRAGEALDDTEKKTYEDGLVAVLREFHDELDSAVSDAFGWPSSVSDEEILGRLVALNSERAAEERRGVVHWLRPDYQSTTGQAVAQPEIPTIAVDAASGRAGAEPQKWPKEIPAQLAAIKRLFDGAKANLSVDDVCGEFKGARRDKVLQHLVSLEGLGLLDRYEAGGVAHWHA